MPQLGVLRACDVRSATDGMLSTSVDVVVLASEGAPFVGRVRLTRKRSGRREHLALVCPRCGTVRLVLRTDGKGGLGCSSCLRYRTDHQLQHANPGWNGLGLGEHDKLERLFLRLGRVAGASPRAERLVQDLLEGDDDRLAAITESATAALSCPDVVMVGEKPMTEVESRVELAAEMATMPYDEWREFP